MADLSLSGKVVARVLSRGPNPKGQEDNENLKEEGRPKYQMPDQIGLFGQMCREGGIIVYESSVKYLQ